MKALVTGLNGTVAPALARHLDAAGHTVVGWDRSAVRTDDPAAVRAFIGRERPDWFFHLAMGSPDWTEEIARTCVRLGVKLLYTSSASVFARTQPGPYTLSTSPGATDDYGRYKIECERRVQAADPGALVARIGWQIGSAPGSNNMMDYFDRNARDSGRVEASSGWYPACAFLEDTAATLTGLMQGPLHGVVHLEGNPGLSLHEIAIQLNRLHGRPWSVVESTDVQWDQRLLDERVPLTPITRRLGQAPHPANPSEVRS